LLFNAAWQTIQTLSGDRKYLSAQVGMTAVLHAWSQSLSLHPGLNCIIPGGGVDKNNNGKLLVVEENIYFQGK